ncbi:unnamed protein product [Cylicocyclus nassatus]|uniref:Glycosyltransferase family 92 protein n=1 Tax=Cylicocyclus nassatus TaxID=53992 RepID=A0AA36GKZ0_CYLNA|nr:unnamed protein product [Cylicocyclus nassatus]
MSASNDCKSLTSLTITPLHHTYAIGIAVTIVSLYLLIAYSDLISFSSNSLQSSMNGAAGTDEFPEAYHKFLRHIRSCVPIFNLIERYLLLNIGYRGRRLCVQQRKRYHTRPNGPNASLSLVGAYAYPNYSVITFEEDQQYGRSVYCRYFNEQNIEFIEPVKSRVFPEHVVHCCRHDGAVYMGVTHRKFEEVIVHIPVLSRNGEDEYKLSFCLSPMYGNETKWLLLVEMIEHYKLQGVEHFYLYIQTVDDYSRRLIDDYVRDGDAEAVYISERPQRRWRQLFGIQAWLLSYVMRV